MARRRRSSDCSRRAAEPTIHRLERLWRGAWRSSAPDFPTMPEDYVACLTWWWGRIGVPSSGPWAGLPVPVAPGAGLADQWGKPGEYVLAAPQYWPGGVHQGVILRLDPDDVWDPCPRRWAGCSFAYDAPSDGAVMRRVSDIACTIDRTWQALDRHIWASGAAATVIIGGQSRSDLNGQAVMDGLDGGMIIASDVGRMASSIAVPTAMPDRIQSILLALGGLEARALAALGIDSRVSDRLSGVAPEELSGSLMATRLQAELDDQLIDWLARRGVTLERTQPVVDLEAMQVVPAPPLAEASPSDEVSST